MKRIFNVIVITFLATAVGATSCARRGAPGARQDGTRPVDYKKALEQARSEKKFLLLDFTGSDWCEGCIRLEKEVFGTPEFKEFAVKNLVFLQIDFPIGNPQTPEVVEQNEKLKKMFGVDPLPNLVVLGGNGRQIASWIGYDGGGPQWLIKKIQSLKKE